jgi:hypothetical protein
MASMESKSKLANDFRRQLIWIVVAGVVAAGMAAAALVLTGPITLSIVFAAALGTFVTFALGAGLMSAVFYSERSGYDQPPTIVSSESPSSDENSLAASARLNDGPH